MAEFSIETSARKATELLNKIEKFGLTQAQLLEISNDMQEYRKRIIEEAKTAAIERITGLFII